MPEPDTLQKINYAKLYKDLGAIKRKMLETNIRHGKATCPQCKQKNVLECVLAGNRNHLHARCHNPECNFASME